MKYRFLLFLIFFNSPFALSQKTKLPTYAIQIQYAIDGIRDTILPKAGGIIGSNSDAKYDSIIFHYNNKKQLIMEQIFRTGILINPTGPYAKSYPDTSRFFREHIYDAKGRKVAIKYGEIFGTPLSGNYRYWLAFPRGGPAYFSFVTRIDSFAYDSHDKQLFYRRYDMFDFNNQDFSMVQKKYLGLLAIPGKKNMNMMIWAE